MTDQLTWPDLRTIAQQRPLFIWGAGSAGITAARRLRDQRIEPAGFIDSRPGERASVEGLAVSAPHYLEELRTRGRTPFVVVASMAADEIARDAAAMGFTAPDGLWTFRMETAPVDIAPAGPDFYAFLHQLRTHALADMPAGARTMLSAGCSGAWYFDWVETHYGHVPRHIGAEMFLPRPATLPANVEWLARDVASVPEVRDDEVDLLFSGQNIEHLWPEQVAGCLREAHRVLAPGGWLVLDSPNRELTAPLVWSHGEHTIEYSTADIREVLELAGFADITLRGLWLCRDRGQVLPLSPFDAGRPDLFDILRRASLARDRADDAFVWWAQARKRHAPDPEALAQALARMFAAAWPERLNRFVVPGPIAIDHEGRWAGFAGDGPRIIADGPLFPLRAGRHQFEFRVRGRADDRPAQIRVDLSRGLGAQETTLSSASATAGHEGAVVAIDITLDAPVTFWCRVRAFDAGGGAGQFLLDCRHRPV